MTTECNQTRFEFHALSGRQVVAQFNGGTISSDAGAILLRQVEQRTGIIARLAGCFRDYRDQGRTEHSVEELVGQRIYGLALGYEDLNDHDQLRQDPLIAVLVGKRDPEGTERRREQDRGKACAGRSTLNRLELTPADADQKQRYKKIVMDEAAVDRLLVEVFLEGQGQAPDRIILDLDATDDPIHGEQEGRFFHGYYQEYCYLPLYIFCGEFLLCARLRPSNIDASAGALEEVQRIVAQIRKAWPDVPIVLRGDSGFCRDSIMTWCEGKRVDYVLGLAKNQRLIRAIGGELYQAQRVLEQTGKAARMFSEFDYRTRKSWSRKRRVVAKAEYLEKGANPPLRGDLVETRADGGASLIRGTVLCAGRDGEPDQGAATVLVRGPHLDRPVALESTSSLLLLLRVSADTRTAPAGAARHRDGPGAMRYHSPSAAEDRRSDSNHGAKGVGLDGLGLPLRRAVHPRLSQFAEDRALALLTKAQE